MTGDALDELHRALAVHRQQTHERMVRLQEEQREFRSRLNTLAANLATLQQRVTRIETEDET